MYRNGCVLRLRSARSVSKLLAPQPSILSPRRTCLELFQPVDGRTNVIPDIWLNVLTSASLIQGNKCVTDDVYFAQLTTVTSRRCCQTQTYRHVAIVTCTFWSMTHLSETNNSHVTTERSSDWITPIQAYTSILQQPFVYLILELHNPWKITGWIGLAVERGIPSLSGQVKSDEQFSDSGAAFSSARGAAVISMVGLAT